MRRRRAGARARPLGDVVGDRREREVRRCVVVVVGLDRTKVSTVSLRESARAVQTDIIRVIIPHFDHHPRSIPAQRIVAMLTNLHGDPGASVSMAIGCNWGRRARVECAWADA